MTATTLCMPPVQPLFPRLLHFGVSYSDLVSSGAGARDWQEWSRRLGERAARYEAAAETAWQGGRRCSAEAWWRRAADNYHFAQLRLPHGPRKRRLQSCCRRAFSRLAACLAPPAERLELPYGTVDLPGFYRSAGAGSPCVLLLGGLDSAKEVELASFARVFLTRGCSVFFFDGPGQGELLGKAPMPLSFAQVVGSVIDGLTERGLCDPEQVGLFGVSFGGHLACRAAAQERRIAACVSLGGCFDGRIFARLPPLAAETVRRTFALPDGERLDGVAREVTLEPVRGLMDRPLLLVHGSEDHLVELEQIEAMQRWAAGAVDAWVVRGAEHVCTDRFAECLPVIGDWMTARLTGGRIPPFFLEEDDEQAHERAPGEHPAVRRSELAARGQRQ